MLDKIISCFLQLPVKYIYSSVLQTILGSVCYFIFSNNSSSVLVPRSAPSVVHLHSPHIRHNSIQPFLFPLPSTTLVLYQFPRMPTHRYPTDVPKPPHSLCFYADYCSRALNNPSAIFYLPSPVVIIT